MSTVRKFWHCSGARINGSHRLKEAIDGSARLFITHLQTWTLKLAIYLPEWNNWLSVFCSRTSFCAFWNQMSLLVSKWSFKWTGSFYRQMARSKSDSLLTCLSETEFEASIRLAVAGDAGDPMADPMKITNTHSCTHAVSAILSSGKNVVLVHKTVYSWLGQPRHLDVYFPEPVLASLCLLFGTGSGI